MEKRKIISKFNVSAYIVREILHMTRYTFADLFNDETFCKKIELTEKRLEDNYLKIDDDADITDIYVAIETESD